MSTPKVVLFYVFTPLADPDAIRLWQSSLCESNNLRGRILISNQGINATVGGELADVKRYLRKTRDYAAFSRAHVKWSEGTGDDFPRLSVRVRREIVTFGAPEELTVDEDGVVGGGVRLRPAQVHDLVAARGDDVVFFDGRNSFESEIGRFKNAIAPPVTTTREFVEVLDSGRYDHLKDRPIVTYCTGGVRCEVLSALLVKRGFRDVYQLDGGIATYGQEFGDDGLWEGAMYVFDSRMSVTFSPAAKTIGRCHLCGDPTSRLINYPDANGRDLTLVCESCVT